MVHAKVEQKPTHAGDDEESGKRVLLQAQRRHGVNRAEEQAKAVQFGDQSSKVRGDDRRSAERGDGAERPRGEHGEFTRSHGQKRLVHLVDVDVINLIDSDDVSIPHQQRQQP